MAVPWTSMVLRLALLMACSGLDVCSSRKVRTHDRIGVGKGSIAKLSRAQAFPADLAGSGRCPFSLIGCGRLSRQWGDGVF